VAICAQHLLLQVDGVIGGATLITDGNRIRMTGDTLSVLDPDEDADGEWIVAAKVRDQLLGPAHFFLDEPRNAGSAWQSRHLTLEACCEVCHVW